MALCQEMRPCWLCLEMIAECQLLCLHHVEKLHSHLLHYHTTPCVHLEESVLRHFAEQLMSISRPVVLAWNINSLTLSLNLDVAPPHSQARLVPS